MFTREQLSAIEEIKQLKANYFYYVDNRMTDQLQELFTDDCEWKMGPMGTVKDKTTYFENVRKYNEKDPRQISVHQGFDPVIELLSETSAKARWSMRAVAQWPGDAPRDGKYTEHDGSGYYYETYVKTGKGWLISSQEVVLRISKYA